MKQISDYADLKYKRTAQLSHIVPFGQPYSLCGAAPMGPHPGDWYGTGSMDEIEKAAAMNICGKCLAEHHTTYAVRSSH